MALSDWLQPGVMLGVGTAIGGIFSWWLKQDHRIEGKVTKASMDKLITKVDTLCLETASSVAKLREESMTSINKLREDFSEKLHERAMKADVDRLTLGVEETKRSVAVVETRLSSIENSLADVKRLNERIIELMAKNEP